MTAWHVTTELHFDEDLEMLHAESCAEREAVELEALSFDAWLEEHARGVLLGVFETLRKSGFPGDLRVPVARANPLMVSWVMVATDDDGAPLEHRFNREGVGVEALADAVGHAVEVEVEHAPAEFDEVTGNIGVSWTLERAR